MASFNLKSMDVDALLKLRADIDAHLANQRRELERQLGRLSSMKSDGEPRRVGRPRKDAAGPGRRSHPLRGKKRPAKFRDPDSGKTWAGVGMRPRWLVDYESQGRKLDEFAVAGVIGADAKRAVKKSARSGKKRGRGRPKAETK